METHLDVFRDAWRRNIITVDHRVLSGESMSQTDLVKNRI